MERRAIRRIAVLVLGWAGLAALAAATGRWEGIRLFSPLEDGSLRAAVLAKGRQAVRRERFPGLRSPLVIQQIGLASPASPVRRDGMPADWIELLNRSRRAVSLKGFALADGPSASRRWTFPDVDLGAGETIRVWADGQNRIGSRWESLDPVRQPRKAWIRWPDPDASSGTVFRSLEVPEPVSGRRLTYQLPVLSSGVCDLWLRFRAEGEEPCRLQVAVDGHPAEPVLARPGRRLGTVRLEPAGKRGAGWTLAEGSVLLDVRLEQGEISMDRPVLTRRDRPFGRGEQDVHLSFKLKASGETLGLYAPRGIPLDVVQFPAMAAGESYRRPLPGRGEFDVGEQRPAGYPMPAPPVLSLPSGYVASGAVVSVRSPSPDVVVRYSLDGSLPDETSPVWSGDWTITGPTMLTVRAFPALGEPSRAATRLYHPGPPMDVPFAWFALRPESQARLLRNRQARGAPSEQPAHLCLFFPDGTAQSADVAIRPQGRSSRLSKVKQGYRIVCRPPLGFSEWPGRIFQEEGAARHGSLVLDGTGLVKHPAALDAMRTAGFVAPRKRHVLFQINRDPMGVYMLCEDPNDPEFWREAFGHLDLDVIKLKTARPVKAGDDRAYRALWSGLDPEVGLSPAELGQWIDPAYFSRWAALHHLMGISDNQQGYFVRDRRKAESPWSFIVWDLDGAFHWLMRDNEGRWPPIEGSRRDVLRSLLRDEQGGRLFAETARSVLDRDLDVERMARRAEEYADLVVRHVDFEWAGLRTQQVDDVPATREELAAIFTQAAAAVPAFLVSQIEDYRKSLDAP